MPRLERGGFMWGLQFLEFLIVAIAILSIVGLMAAQQIVLALVWAVIAIPAAVCAIVAPGGRSLVRRGGTILRHRARLLLGETRWRTAEAPVPAGRLMLPGAVGARLSIHTTKYGHGALIFDAGTRRATAVIRCESAGWANASDDERASRGRGFRKVCNSLVKRPAVKRVAIMARTIPSDTVAAKATHDQTVRDREVHDPWIEDVMDEVWDGRRYVDGEGNLLGPEEQRVAVARDTLVVISVSIAEARGRVKSYGGGLAGAADVLAEEVRGMTERLRECGVTLSTWMTAADLGDAVRLAGDLDAAEILAKRHDGQDPDVFSRGAMLMVDDSNPKALVTSGGVHATWHIAEWPQTEVETGFLEDIICSGEYAHTVTQVFTPVGTGQGLRQVQKGITALESKFDINKRLGRPTSILDRRAAADLKDREEELADGNVDVRVVGYVRVSAKSKEELDVHEQEMMSAASSLDLQRMDGQQWEAFVASSLPVGWGL